MKGRNRARRLVSVSRQLGQLDPVRTNQENIALVHSIIKLSARFFWEEKRVSEGIYFCCLSHAASCVCSNAKSSA